MTSERWERIKEVVANAVEQRPDERAEFISAACADDTALRREVESIVSQSDAHLERCAEQISGPLTRGDSLIGIRLGAYEIIREIGRGGMGAVYLARRADDTFEKKSRSSSLNAAPIRTKCCAAFARSVKSSRGSNIQTSRVSSTPARPTMGCRIS